MLLLDFQKQYQIWENYVVKYLIFQRVYIEIERFLHGNNGKSLCSCLQNLRVLRVLEIKPIQTERKHLYISCQHV